MYRIPNILGNNMIVYRATTFFFYYRDLKNCERKNSKNIFTIYVTIDSASETQIANITLS